jgi:hypothetical protein
LISSELFCFSAFDIFPFRRMDNFPNSPDPRNNEGDDETKNISPPQQQQQIFSSPQFLSQGKSFYIRSNSCYVSI